MTCIVGLLDKKTKKVFMGADSAGVGDMDIAIRRDAKIFKNGDFLIGCTTSFRMIQLLRYSLSPPKVEKEIYEYMCTDFINAVRECFKVGGFLMKDTDGQEKGGQFLVGYKNRLFKIGSDFQVAENMDGIDAVGCGYAYALGALSALNIPPKERILKALEASARFSAGVAKPFLVYDTKSM